MIEITLLVLAILYLVGLKVGTALAIISIIESVCTMIVCGRRIIKREE